MRSACQTYMTSMRPLLGASAALHCYPAGAPCPCRDGCCCVQGCIEQSWLPSISLALHTQPSCALDRFDAAPQPITSAVSIYFDGSVLVIPGGIEMGQGLHTKIKQVQKRPLCHLVTMVWSV